MVTKETVLEDDQRILFSKTHIRAGGPHHNAKCKLYRPQGSHPIHHLSYFVYFCTTWYEFSSADSQQQCPCFPTRAISSLRGRVRAMHASSASRNLATEIDERPASKRSSSLLTWWGTQSACTLSASQSYHSKTFLVILLSFEGNWTNNLERCCCC